MTEQDTTAARVLNLLRQRNRETGEDVQRLIERYVAERFLHRLGESELQSILVLKGAALFSLWLGLPHRPTRDLDFASADNLSELEIADKITMICLTAVAGDGVTFDVTSLKVTPIREGRTGEGFRAVLRAFVGRARVRMQIDIGFGDVVTPAPKLEQYPSLLDDPPPIIMAYPRSTVVAEKLEIIVHLGIVNSRMKDYFDLRELAHAFDFELNELAAAVRATFQQRSTPFPRLSRSPLILASVVRLLERPCWWYRWC